MSDRNKNFVLPHIHTSDHFFCGFALGYLYSLNFTNYVHNNYMHISIIQREADTQLQQPMEYTAVDNSTKKSKKGDKQHSVSI